MQARRRILALAIWAVLLGACSGQGPSGSAGKGASAGPGASLGPGGPGGPPSGSAGSPNPSASATPGIPGPGGTAPVGGGSGTIVGTIDFRMTLERSDDVIYQVLKESLDFTVNVQLVRDNSFDPEEVYVDDGSTYTVKVRNSAERQLGDCMALSETKADAAHAFSDQPTSYENQIQATVNRTNKTVVFDAWLSWMYEVTGNACDGRDPYTWETGVSLFCPAFVLTAKLIEGMTTDTIDAGCVMPGGETYTGILTLTR